MLRHLKVLFQDIFSENEEIDEASALRMACAVLMFEILRADHDAHEAEVTIIRQHIRDAFGLDEDNTEVLMQLAREESESAVSLHHIVRTINDEYDPPEKRELIKMLWDVAYADGRLDPYEEYAIRKLADLLYIPHRDFILSKHQAMTDS